MGNTIVDQVIGALSGAGIRADEAYPGARIPALTGAVAAVRLGKVDRAVRTTTVQVTVMSPATSGGAGCEKIALKAVNVLQKMNGTCTKEICKFDEMADVFYIDIAVAFFGCALDNSWSAGPGYALRIGMQSLPYVVRFQIQRSTDEEITAISNALWNFTIEELIPPGVGEPLDPAEPFTVTIDRSLGQEVLEGCKWISVKREDTIRGISQIRVGTAAVRKASTIL